MRRHSHYPGLRRLSRWLATLGIAGAVLAGAVLHSRGNSLAGAGVGLCGVAGSLLSFWLVTLLADVADMLADQGRK